MLSAEVLFTLIDIGIHISFVYIAGGVFINSIHFIYDFFFEQTLFIFKIYTNIVSKHIDVEFITQFRSYAV